MTLLRAAAAAFSMYSRLPMPRVEWTAPCMAWALCFFPLVGAVVGVLLVLWLWLCALLGLGPALPAAGALLVPLAVTGGIHLDGLCDTADALASHQSRERKLEILKDSHIGAFGVIACAVYLITLFAAWLELPPAGNRALLWAVGLVPVLSRALSGLMALTLPNARGSGLLCAFTQPAHQGAARGVLAAWVVLVCAVMFLTAGTVYALSVLCAAVLVLVYYVCMSRRQFGGITGDLAGFFLQLCELGCLLALAIGPKVWEVAQQWF